MKHTKKLLSAVLVLSLLLTSGFLAFATHTQISNVEATRIVNIPSKKFGETSCSCIGGLGVYSNAMYTIKVSNDNTKAKLYYFEDYTNVTNAGRKIFNLTGVGHANGMTVDTNYLYITTWTSGNENNIMRIQLSKLRGWTDGTTITPSTTGVKIFDPIIKDLVNSTSTNTVYKDYPYMIGSITRHYADGRFIIRAEVPGHNDDDYAFTRASVKTINNVEQFVVSHDEDNIFFIKNVIDDSVTDQDIFYSEDNGFFLPKSHYGGNGARNRILWANIKGGYNDTTKTINGKTYRAYTPTEIVFDRHNDKGWDITRFNVYEVESCAMTPNNELYISINVIYNSAYLVKYDEVNNPDTTGDSPAADRIIKLTHDNGQNFTLS